MTDTLTGEPSTKPRCVRRSDIERDYGLRPAVFSRLVAKGFMPRCLPGTRLWDSCAIDHALNKLAGLDKPANENQTEADRWFRDHGVES